MRIYKALAAHDQNTVIVGRLFTEAETGHSYIAVGQGSGFVTAVRANAMTIQLVDEWEPLNDPDDLRLGDVIKTKDDGRFYTICAYRSFSALTALNPGDWLVKKKPVDREIQ